MSLPAPYSEVYLEGTGTRVEFPFGTNFKPIAANLVKCIVYLEDGNEIIPTYTVDMTVGSITISALTLPDGTILTAPPVGSTVRIYRDEPEAQNTTASQLQAYTAKQLETTLDAIVAMIQEVSYTVDHKTIRLTEPQRDIALQELSDLVDGHLIYWDLDTRRLVVTNYPQQDVVRCVNGLFFRLRTDPDTHQPYLQWSVDNSDWYSINIDATQALAQSAYDLADSAYDLASTTRGELNAHKADLANPHQTSMSKLTDVEIQGLTGGQFLSYDGMKWKNVDYSAVVTWSGVLGDIYDNLSAKTALDAKVNIDGTSIMTAPLKFMAGSMRGAVGPYLNGVGFWKLDSQANLTLIATISDSQFIPNTTNAINFGSSTKKWKDLYLAGKAYISVINNGYDIAIPVTNSADTFALKSEVDLAANSGRMITDQGVWYAKMDPNSTVPSYAEVEGRNYADFTQTDQDNNPIIVIYTYTSGAWDNGTTVVPPAEYDGYVPVTAKIWDIPEQAGQQGGRILWNHQSKEFTAYPQIVSFDGQNITNSTFSGGTITNSTFSGTATLSGESTVNMPQDPTGDQIVNKDYVDNHIPTSGLYHPDLFDWKWADHQVNDVQWLRADTFSWQSGAVYQAAYQHLVDDYSDAPYLTLKTRYDHGGQSDYIMYYRDPSNDTTSPGGALPVLTPIYAWTTDNASAEYATLYSDRLDSFPALLYYISGSTLGSTSNTTPLEWYKYKPETVAGISINCCQAADGHKIVLADQESAVAAIYAATGVAWYYIIDTTNERFKLPRTKWGINGLRDTVGNMIDQEILLPNITGNTGGCVGNATPNGVFSQRAQAGTAGGGSGRFYVNNFDASRSSSVYSGNGSNTLIQPRATQMYLYFYVGEFTQSALENTAGITAETLNDKVDVGHEVVEFQAPTADNNYTWYRKYADGWVEQGGQSSASASATNASPVVSVPLLVEMADTNYTAIANASFSAGSAWNGPFKTGTSTTTEVKFTGWVSGTSTMYIHYWEVKGMAA